MWLRSICKLSTDLPTAPQTSYTKGMNKQPDLAAIMASYTAQYNDMMARSAANRQAFAEGRPQPYQAVPTETINISDRH